MTNREKFSLNFQSNEGEYSRDTVIINNAAERIFRELDIKTVFTWEELTFGYIKREVPRCSSIEDSAYMMWVRLRPTYVEAINRRFTEEKMDAYLDVRSGVGVVLLHGQESKNCTGEKRFRKNLSVLTKSIKALRDGDKRLGATYPNPLIATLQVNLMVLYGELDFTELPAPAIKSLKAKVKRFKSRDQNNILELGL